MGTRTKGERLMKIRDLITTIGVSVMLISSLCVPSFAVDYNNDEDGTEETVYVQKDTNWFQDNKNKKSYTIRTEAQLIGLASLVNEEQYDRWKENKFETFEDVTIELERDIKLTQPWEPIGKSDDICFRGVFEGNGHTISGLDINSNGGYTGLFGFLSGEVRNLTVKGKVVSSGSQCGAIAGMVSESGIITNCESYVDVSGQSKTGGITGYNDKGIVQDCINYGNISGTMKIGGVVGENWGTVTRCGNRGDVTSTVRGATTYGTGGVAGRSVSPYATLDKCFNTGNIKSGTEGTGGVVGYINATGTKVTNCYNVGHIKVDNQNPLVVKMPGYSGGVVGIAGIKGVIIRNCYSVGTVYNNDFKGGVVGKYSNESKTKDEPYITNNYYTNASGIKGVASDNTKSAVDIPGGTEKMSSSSLMYKANLLGNAYTEDSTANYGSGGFPVLKWQTERGKVDKEYSGNIPVEMQKEFDSFINENPLNERKGWSLLMFFKKDSFSTLAIGDFHENF